MMTRKDFGERKAKGEFPLGSVPCWIEDGDIICQSNVILRMIGNRTGMYSTDPETAWNIDSAMEALEDTMDGYKPYIFKQVMAKDGQAGPAEVESMVNFYKKNCELIERRLSKHGQKYIVGDKVTVADLKLFGHFTNGVYNDNMPMAESHRQAAKDMIAKYPKTQQYMEQTMM